MWGLRIKANSVDNERRSFTPGGSMFIQQQALSQTSNIKETTSDFARLVQSRKRHLDEMMIDYMDRLYESSLNKGESKPDLDYGHSRSPSRAIKTVIAPVDEEDKENILPRVIETERIVLEKKESPTKIASGSVALTTSLKANSILTAQPSSTKKVSLSPVKSDDSDYSFINVQTNIRKSVGFREARFQETDNNEGVQAQDKDTAGEDTISKNNEKEKNYTTSNSPFKEDGDISLDDATFNKVELHDLMTSGPDEQTRSTSHTTPYVAKSPVKYASLPSRDPLVIKSSSGPKSGRKKRLSKMSLDRQSKNQTTNVNSYLTTSLSPSGLKTQSQYSHLRQSQSHVPVPINRLLNSSSTPDNNHTNRTGNTGPTSELPMIAQLTADDIPDDTVKQTRYSVDTRFTVESPKMISSTPTGKTVSLFSNTGLSSTKTSVSSTMDIKAQLPAYPPSSRLSNSKNSPFARGSRSPLNNMTFNKSNQMPSIPNVSPENSISHPFLSPSKSSSQSDNVFSRLAADTQSSARRSHAFSTIDLSSPKQKRQRPSEPRLSSTATPSYLSSHSKETIKVSEQSLASHTRSFLSRTTETAIATTTTTTSSSSAAVSSSSASRAVVKPKSFGRGLTSLSLANPNTSKTTSVSTSQYTANPFLNSSGTSIVPSIHDLRSQNSDSARLPNTKKSLPLNSNGNNKNRQSEKRSLYLGKPTNKKSSLSVLTPPTLSSAYRKEPTKLIRKSNARRREENRQQLLEEQRQQQQEIPDFPSEYEYEDPSNVLASWGDASTIKELLMSQRLINPDDIFGSQRRPISIVEVFGSNYGGVNAASGFKSRDILSQRDIEDYDIKMGWRH